MIKEKLIVLRTHRTGEADLIVRGLNARGAKVSLLAHAALKSKKRFGGGILEPTHYLAVCYKPAKDPQGLAVLSEAQLLNEFSGLRSSYERVELAWTMLKLADRLSQEGTVDSIGLFDLLGHSLTALETSESLTVLRLQFTAKALHGQGILTLIAPLEPLLKTPVAQHAQLTLTADVCHDVDRHLRQVIEGYLQSSLERESAAGRN